MGNGITSGSVRSTEGTPTRRLIGLAAAAAGLLVPAVAMANNSYLPDPNSLTLAPVADRPVTDSDSLQKPSQEPLLLDEAAAPTEQPNIHGFFSSPFKTAYVTPRGLVVQDKGLVWQPVVGLVFPIGDMGPVKNLTFVGGIWNSVDTYESQFNHTTGAWDEMDIFASFSGTVANVFSLNLTYGLWESPEHAFVVEHNLDLKISYADTKMWGDTGFSLNPYIDIWWAMAGSSTVILGRHGNTGYIEPGIVPTFTVKAMENYPLTVSVPIYVSIGKSDYWDAAHTYTNSIFGLVSASVNLSVPLNFVPVKYGHWHADAGVTYDNLLNSALLHAGTLASGNTSRNVVIGTVGFGVNF